MSNEIEVNKGGAPVNNTNAEKWNVETTSNKLNELLQEAERHNVLYIGQGLANIGMYAQWYSEMAEKFKDNEVISETIKRIDQTFEAKLVNQTLIGELNPTMAIFTLKNKHNWKDKTENENKNLNVNVNTDGPMTAEKAKAIRDKLKNDY